MDIEKQIEKLVQKIKKDHKTCEVLYVSLGNKEHKASVNVLKKERYFEQDILKTIQQYKKKSGKDPEWIKVDVVTDYEFLPFLEVKDELENTRRNYVKFGISFDKDWLLSFLPEEINANALLKPSTEEKGKLIFSEKNINAYIKRYKNAKRPYRHAQYRNKELMKFETQGYFLEDGKIIELHGEGMDKGLRKVKNIHDELDKLISTSTEFLATEIKPNGQFIYGYFSHFDREINFYNNLRHASSTYAMIEGLRYLDRDINVARAPINYLLKHKLIKKDDDTYFVFDDTNDMNEIKLGQNAAFILALTEYLKVHDDEYYLSVAKKLANGILHMIDFDKMETTHVLHYPSLKLKQKYRIIYYDGEAALALLRLYQIDKNDLWLDSVKRLFEMFIEKDYWKHHDHWLGYCTNELVKIEPKEEYIIFGLRNASGHLDFIKNRETTFPTFLELLMSTYYLTETAKDNDMKAVVDAHIDVDELLETIHRRADYERIGYFYPEVAMYFKNPERILGSFFIKHHGYRVRIDDIEHYISGLVHYQYVFNPRMKNKK